jgi:hypothetical protein
MTWRTFFYLLVVGFAIAVTAFTASSEALAVSAVPALAGVEPAANLDDQSSRWVLLVVGIGTVVLTYRQAYLNLRR